MRQPAFNCQRCNQCCHGEGGISLEPGEVPAAAALLGLTPDQFITSFCRLKDGRYDIRINEQGDCALLGPQGCLIHQAKPRICALWPYFPALLRDPGAFEEAKLSCPGLAQASHADFVAEYQAQQAQKKEQS
jgi:Fe-S-cluster containining protein